MTCIVAYRTKDMIVMGGDSFVSSDWDRIRLKDHKIFQKGDLLFGYTGPVHLGQLLETFEVPPPQPKMSVKRYAQTLLIDAMRAHFQERYFNSGGASWAILVGYKGHIFLVEETYQVLEPRLPYAACGCGESYALGALWVLVNTDLPAKVMVKTALMAAAAHSAGVEGPFRILTLETKKS